MIGQMLGHYRIVEKIGEGGMGVVYRARDERLDRDVALKLLPPDALTDEAARRRFTKEAQLLAKLNHPNIETLYEFATHDGSNFLVMEYVPGLTLDKMLSAGTVAERDVVRLGVQLARGLAAAHGEDVVHRDLKPGNLRMTPDGRLKILDFGLARLLRPASEISTTDAWSDSRAVAGTLPYMAPEQLLGKPADFRTDIYSAGAVLYEMATGQRPFPETQGPRLIDSIFHQAPLQPSTLNRRISPALESLILKALDKDPERRHQSAKELVVDLDRLSAPTPVIAPAAAGPRLLRRHWPVGVAALALVIVTLLLVLNVGSLRQRLLGRSNAARIESLAVLPLDNLSHDPDQEYFAEGLTEALIGELSQIRALSVISRTSAMQYKGTKKPLKQIAAELHVDGFVEGSVQRSGDRVRVTAELIYAHDDKHVWARSYDYELRDVLALESIVARAIADEIQVKLTPQESQSLAQNRTVNTQAFEAYLRGRYFWNKRTPEDLRRAVGEFKKAIDLDPTYPLAWAGLADGYSMLSDYDEQRPQDAMPQARTTAKKALELDSSLGEPWATLANVEWAYDWNASAAETDFQHAIALNPNYATAHQWYGMYLCNGARFDEGIAELERARTIDPLSLVIEVNTGRCRYYARDYNRAVEVLEALERREPDYWIVHAILGQTYLSMGQLEDSIRELERARSLSPDSTRNLGMLGDAYGRAGRRDDALVLVRNLAVLSRKRYIPPIYIAMVYLGLGDRSQAMVFLEKAYKDRSNWMVLLKSDPEFDSLRSDGRFRELLNRITPLTQQSEESLQTQNVLDRDADARRVSLLDTARRRD